MAFQWQGSAPLSPGGPVEKKTQKFAVHACGYACDGGKKRNVLIVSVLLPIGIGLALRSNMQRRVDVLRVCQAPILQGVTTTPITVMGDTEVEDQAPAASLVP